METIKMTSGGYFKSIKIVHIALVIGVVLFALAAVFLQINGFHTADQEFIIFFLVVVSMFALFGIIASNLIFKKKLRTIRGKPHLKVKMEEYRTALITKLALIEGPAFFAVVAYLVTGDYIFLGITFVLIIVFLIYTPSKTKFINDLELTKNESELINKSDSEIQ